MASFKQVCKYYPQGNLVKYLKGLSKADAARNDAVKMIYEISKGMAYLHEQGVLHGDLKVRIPALKADSLVKQMTLHRPQIYLLTMTRVV